MDLEAHLATLIGFLQANQHYLMPIAFLMAFGECVAFISLLVPGAAFFTLLGALGGAAGINLLPAAIAGACGAWLGFWVSYWLGVKMGPGITAYWPFSRHPDMLPRGQAFFEKWGAMGIVLGHFFGPVRAVVALAAGLCAMPPLLFHAANLVASVLWSFLLLYASGAAGDMTHKLLTQFVN